MFWRYSVILTFCDDDDTNHGLPIWVENEGPSHQGLYSTPIKIILVPIGTFFPWLEMFIALRELFSYFDDIYLYKYESDFHS